MWRFWWRARGRGKIKTAGRVPQDAALFVQAATKKCAKKAFLLRRAWHSRGRLVLGPVQQLTGWRLRSTERQRPQLNKFRWAGLFPWRFVGNAGGDNEIFPSAGPSLRLQAFHLPSSAGVCNNQAVSLAHRHRRQERSSQTRPLSNALTVRNHTDSTRMP